MADPIVPEDLYRFQWIDHVRLSPDGERVAYEIGWADEESAQNRSRIVVRRLLDPEPVEPTGVAKRDHSPEWSPDGSKLAFLSKVGAADQVFVIDVAAGALARQVSFVPDGASSPAWSPDGSRIAFGGVVLSDPEAVVDDPRPTQSREQVRRVPVARTVRRLDYKFDGQGFKDGRYRHLFVVPASGGDVKQLTSGAWDVNGFDWSPDSARLVVSGNAEPGADLRRELNLYLVDLEGYRQLLGGGFYLDTPMWSPRGDVIAFRAPNGLDAGLLDRLWVVPLAGGGPTCLTANFDQATDDTVINDMRAGHGARFCWSPEGDRLTFLSSAPGVTGIYSVDLDGNVRQEVGGQRRIFDFDRAKGVLAFCASDSENPGELHLVTQGAEAKLTDLNPWLRDRYIAQPEHHDFTAPDGWRLEGWVLKPQGLDPSRLHPMVMEIHGGPHAQYGSTFFHEFQVLAGMGFVVFYLNPRGSDGYGERFRREVVRDWAGKDYLDLMSALDQIIDRTGYIDTSRMGVGGGSYGGYMTNWIVGQTNRFSAAVSMRPLSNLVSWYAQNDTVIWGELELGPPPWPNQDELWRRSPIRYVHNIRTPLLITCGEMDLRVAISQSEEMFGALRLLGKTVEFVRFPEESHDLSRNGRPDRRLERLRRIDHWYERFLGTAATERISEEATQILPIPAEAPREWAKTIAISTRPPVPAEATAPEIAAAVAEPAAVEEAAPAVEPEVEAVEPVVAPVEEPEAQPVEPPQQEEAEPEPDLMPAAELPQPEPVAEEVEPEPAAAAADESPAALEPEVIQPNALEPELTLPEVSQPEVIEPEALEPEVIQPEVQEPVAAEPEVAEPEGLPVLPEPEPVEAEAASEPIVEPYEPVTPAHLPALTPEAEVQPEPEPVPSVVASQSLPPTNPPSVRSTIVAWPSGSPVAASDNGAPSGQQGYEEATSVIPAWQHPDPSASKRTVSLQALPPEEVAAGTEFAALLTFETGPFAGRIVALPNQMVTFGRAPDNDVVVGDPATSGHHGRIDVRRGSFWISDLGSTNGTLINGEPVIEKQLTNGDVISIGQNAIRFTIQQ